MLLVEQNTHLALSPTDRTYTMNEGQVVYEPGAKELAEGKETQHRLLGA